MGSEGTADAEEHAQACIVDEGIHRITTSHQAAAGSAYELLCWTDGRLHTEFA